MHRYVGMCAAVSPKPKGQAGAAAAAARGVSLSLQTGVRGIMVEGQAIGAQKAKRIYKVKNSKK